MCCNKSCRVVVPLNGRTILAHEGGTGGFSSLVAFGTVAVAYAASQELCPTHSSSVYRGWPAPRAAVP